MSRSIAVLALLLLAAPGRAEEQGPLLRALGDELARAPQLRVEGAPAPYFVSYDVEETQAINLVAALGSLELDESGRGRSVRVVVRVGEPGFDSGNFEGGGSVGGGQLPLDDDYAALRRALWQITDGAYKSAARTLERKRAALAGQTPPPEAAGDFAAEPPARLIAPAATPAIDRERFVTLVEELSAALRGRPEIKESYAALSVQVTRRTFLSSEGTLVIEPRVLVSLDLMGAAQADDGMVVTDHRSWRAVSLDGLPPREVLLAETRRFADELAALRAAPLLDDYEGPVLFTGEAAPAILADTLALDFSGTPPPRAAEARERSQPLGRLAEKVGQRVLPAGFRVEDDPGLARLGGLALTGGYVADDEGVPGRRVVLVDDGALKDLLMSRTPRAGHEKSNGHARMTWGGALACPSNLILTVKGGLAAAALEQRLLAAARAAGLQRALIVERVAKPVVMRYLAEGLDGSRDALMRGGEDAVPPPTVVYELSLDGKRRLVRGAVLGPIPTRAWKRVLAAGKDLFVDPAPDFGMAALRGGAGLLGLRASVVAPALLFEDISVERGKGGQGKPPIVPMPAEK